MAAGNVLVVDDDADVRETLVDVLRENGFHTLSAVDGDSAFAMLELLPKPCVVLLDHLMPGKNGAEVATELLGGPHSKQIHVVVISASAVTSPRGTAFLRKPFEVDALLALMEHLCAGPPLAR